MLKVLIYGSIKVVVVWSLATYFSVVVGFHIAKDWLLRFHQKPWQSKKRDEPPKCLKDPKYGMHKYVRVNVSREKNNASTAFLIFFLLFRRKFVCITSRRAIAVNR